MEAALLAALEKRDAESYNLLKATQDVELAGETVRPAGPAAEEGYRRASCWR